MKFILKKVKINKKKHTNDFHIDNITIKTTVALNNLIAFTQLLTWGITIGDSDGWCDFL